MYNKETKKAAHIALVHPTVEYSSTVWDAYTKELIQNVEKIQKRAPGRFITIMTGNQV